MINNEMMKMKEGQQKCQINNTVTIMCEDPSVKINHIIARAKDKEMLMKVHCFHQSHSRCGNEEPGNCTHLIPLPRNYFYVYNLALIFQIFRSG